MSFFQGGGFLSNFDTKFNGSHAAFGNMVVIQVNYLVGPYGFLQSKKFLANCSLNNGHEDFILSLKWTNQALEVIHIVALAVGHSARAMPRAFPLAAFVDNKPRYVKVPSWSPCPWRHSEPWIRDVLALHADQCQFTPHFDDDLVKSLCSPGMTQGSIKIPVIAGTCTNEGTKNVPQDSNRTAESPEFINNQASGVL
ncbi:hypothetical protein VTK73DRAFT_4438 [Phialemonium thermophilum]|uniref:Carboxylesterase type B domain-containing protein n=1 Tax=Phialemonium thermophilum TaxID=223376 RepID=A0ABR3WU26_9PEZI